MMIYRYLFITLFGILFSTQMNLAFAQQRQTAVQQVKPDPKMGTIGIMINMREPGLVVQDVVAKSSGEKAGFKTGDKISSINKIKVADSEAFMAVRRKCKTGDVLTISGTDANNKPFVRKVEIMPVS